METAFTTNYKPGRTIETLTRERILQRISHTPTESFGVMMKLNRLAVLIKRAKSFFSKKAIGKLYVSLVQHHEIINLWSAFQAFNVQYIMCGDLAIHFYNPSIHFTNEFDIYIDDSIENRKRLGQALEYLGICKKDFFDSVQFTPGWLQVYLNGFVLNFFTRLNENSETSFDQHNVFAHSVEIENIPIKFLHLNHLLESKRAANRPKDQIDVLALEEIKIAKQESGEM